MPNIFPSQGQEILIDPIEIERLTKVKSILAPNTDKDFVQRIISPQDSPFIKNKDGSESSHKMAFEVGEALGLKGERATKWYVFPTIQRESEGSLVDYKDWKKAWPSAEANQDFIEFDSKEEAEWFERNWKAVWGHPARK